MNFIKRHAFLVFFLIVQLIFIAWIAPALGGTGSQDDAEAAGSFIAGLIILGVWVFVDLILGISYGVYRLARRK